MILLVVRPAARRGGLDVRGDRRGQGRRSHHGHGRPGQPAGGGFEILDITVIALSLVAWLAWILIQIPTYRHADGERRQQLKWLYSGATVTLVAFVFGVS